ncbi:MAG: DUF3775 domain-containing protein [Gammaproteobacteria bacterium]|jgi:hypothetical protein
MLELNPELVCQIIGKAREFHAKEEVVITEEPSSPTDDWAIQVLADHADDLTFSEVKDTIDDLEPDQQITLVSLMWIGRGDFEPDEWEQAQEQARDEWTDRTAEYLLATPLVSDYLEEGLYRLGYSCEE